MISRGTVSLQALAQGAVLSLVLGKISEDHWQNLKQTLDVDWENPDFLSENESVLNELGSLLLQCPEKMVTQKICARFGDLCRKFSKAAILYLHCANLFAKTGQIREATDLYKRLLARHQKWQSVYYNYGLLHLSRGSYAPAERLLRKGLEFKPGNTAMRLALAKALEGQGKAEEAAKEWRLIRAFQAVEPYGTAEETLE
ncbi:unnamed protein product [marine sediment metagenome]|uniref:Uncharacterized protein n=1 Tax=marine sediment metagenome TaxID=412755 RepID=X1K004_9ZZZZ